MEARKYSDPPDVELPTADQLPTKATLARTGSTRKRNVVMVFLESVRASSTTLVDPSLNTTPFLAELAKTSLVASNAYAVVPHTSKALTAGHCGVAPPLDMQVTEAKPRGIYARCLPQLLRDQGYRTAFFQSATEHFEYRSNLVSNFGHQDFFPVDTMPKKGSSRANYFGWEDDIMLRPSRDWLKQDPGRPLLATYLTVTSHHDYVVPSSIDVQQLAADPELNKYLNTIRYQDRFLKRLFDQYRKLGLYQNTVFVIVGDHGEGFGEHGLRQHDNTVYNEGVRIPLLVHDPQNPRQRTMRAPVQATALLATVAELLGSPVRIACYGDDRCMALVRGNGKFVFHFGQRPDEFFDLATDPGEERNVLARQDRATMVAMRADLLRWRAQVRGMTALGRS
jgi:phosphoglycerol transferase MdoB-like AlkP superfamily enzyme